MGTSMRNKMQNTCMSLGKKAVVLTAVQTLSFHLEKKTKSYSFNEDHQNVMEV